MIEDDEDYLNFSDADMVGTPPGPGFNGVHLYTDTDGNMAMTLFRDGRMIDLIPHEDFRSLPVGFYDLDMNPIPDPFKQAG